MDLDKPTQRKEVAMRARALLKPDLSAKKVLSQEEQFAETMNQLGGLIASKMAWSAVFAGSVCAALWYFDRMETAMGLLEELVGKR